MAYRLQDVFFHSNAPVTIDGDRCTADKGCAVYVEVCPVDLLTIDPTTRKAYTAYDEYWYCMPCEKDYPVGMMKAEISCLLC